MSHIPTFRQTIPLFITNSPNDGATNINASQNEFTIDITPPIIIPSAYRGTIRLLSSQIWYTIPNVSQSLYNNNILTINNGGGNIVINYPTGLYDVAGINDYLNDQLINLGLPGNLIIYSGIEATGSMSVRLGNNTMRIIWSLSTIAPLLGWTMASPNTGPGNINTTYTSPLSASFNSLESIQIHASIASGSYLGSRGGSDIVATIVPDTTPGSLIRYTPLHLIETMLNTRNINRIHFRLTDQQNREIDLSSERYSMVFEIVMTPI